MNLDERIRTTHCREYDVIVPQVYTGDAQEYIVFNHSEYPLEFADDAPQTVGYSIQSICLLLKVNGTKDVSKRFVFAGFAINQDVTDNEGSITCLRQTTTRRYNGDVKG